MQSRNKVHPKEKNEAKVKAVNHGKSKQGHIRKCTGDLYHEGEQSHRRPISNAKHTINKHNRGGQSYRRPNV